MRRFGALFFACHFNGTFNLPDYTNLGYTNEPDYTAGVTVASGYTATEKCWLHAYTSGDGASKQAGEGIVYVNGVRVVGARVSSWSYQTINEIMVPLDVGDVVTTYTNLGTAVAKIIPMKMDKITSTYCIKYI